MPRPRKHPEPPRHRSSATLDFLACSSPSPPNSSCLKISVGPTLGGHRGRPITSHSSADKRPRRWVRPHVLLPFFYLFPKIQSGAMCPSRPSMPIRRAAPAGLRPALHRPQPMPFGLTYHLVRPVLLSHKPDRAPKVKRDSRGQHSPTPPTKTSRSPRLLLPLTRFAPPKPNFRVPHRGARSSATRFPPLFGLRGST